MESNNFGYFIVLIIIAWLFCGVSVSAAFSGEGKIKRIDGSTITTRELEKNISRLMTAAHVTGLSAAIINDSKIAYVKSFGLRDKEKNLPLTENTSVRGLSLTKAIFAYFVMKQVENGTIDLDKPIYQYFEKPALPEYEKYKDLASDERYKKLTARILLDHTSGFPNYRWIMPDGTQNYNAPLQFKFNPGERYGYSGEGINLLQLVVENVTQKSIENMMREQIFQPFDMQRTSMAADDRLEDDFALGYDEKEKPVERRKMGSRAAGSMITTINDYAKFIQAMMQERGLKKSSFDEMLKPQIQIFSKAQFPTLMTETTDENKAIHLSYGLGWGILKTPRGKAFFKEGHDDGWQNYAICFPDKKIAVAIMSNSANAESIFKELLEISIKDIYTPWKWENYMPYNLRQI